MATQSIVNRSSIEQVHATSFTGFAGVCSILAGITAFVYAVAFVILYFGGQAPALGAQLYPVCQLLNGLLTTAVMVGLYERLRSTEPGFALWGVILGIVGALGFAIHGAYDLAFALNAPAPADAAVAKSLANLPSPIDPRGFVSFVVAGIGLYVIAWLMARSGQFSRSLSVLGYVAAILLVWLYLGRLIIVNPGNPLLLIPVLVSGFVVNPGFYIWLGTALRRTG